MSDILPAVYFHTCLANPINFAVSTNVECFRADESREEWISLDDEGLLPFLDTLNNREPSSKPVLHAFFVPLTPTAHSSFGCSVSMTRESVEQLFSKLNVDPAFAMNIIGRPDYWSPMTHLRFDDEDALQSCEYWCQHPRWNLHYQGAPLSIYMRYDCRRNTILYIISYKEDDTIIQALRSILNLSSLFVAASPGPEKRSRMYLEDPFHLHSMISSLSFEAMKNHVSRFRRFMYHNAMEEHLTGLINTDRRALGEQTTALQTTCSNADSLIVGAEVAIITGSGIRNAHLKFHEALGSPYHRITLVAETVQYVVDSFKKQKMWLLNYQQRNQNSIGLVYNLVTQDDAANNIGVAIDMCGDSASMNAIALLTMLFLPATFTATILGANIFNESAALSSNIKVTNFWWLWLVLTVPLTIVTVVSWRIYHRRIVGTLLKTK
ncbi:hypothetical protein C8J57DRAFT_1435452 [Mycena rebaudengoi]|nr:hypothetical protein C8J57DRAFT_1435452 [Mycena rebaudengoi]